jgi:hypothetical protein
MVFALTSMTGFPFIVERRGGPAGDSVTMGNSGLSTGFGLVGFIAASFADLLRQFRLEEIFFVSPKKPDRCGVGCALMGRG